jgi:hypothetical protein
MCKFIKGTIETIGCEENQTPSTHVLESEDDDFGWVKDELDNGTTIRGLRPYGLDTFMSEGDTIYVSGNLYLEDGGNSNTRLYLDDEPVTVLSVRKNVVNVKPSDDMLNGDMWQQYLGGETHIDLGSLEEDGDLRIKLDKPINESEQDEWRWDSLRENFLNGSWELIDKINEQLNENTLMNEQAGISFESRKWADIVYGVIMDNPQEKTRLIIDGYDYPEAFEDFPIDYVVIDYYDKITGYGQEHSGYDNDGNYVVLLYVQPGLVQGKANYDLKSALNHEFKHAWDDYNRLSKGRPSIDNTRESKELYNKDFIQLLSNKQITGPIKDLLKYHYYLSNLERPAYLENVYDGNPNYENMLRGIIRKDFEQLKDRFDLDVNWHLINTAYDIPFLKRFKSPRDLIDYSAKNLTQKAQKMLKKINKMKYVHGKL